MINDGVGKFRKQDKMRLNTQAKWNSTLKKLQMLNIVQLKSCFLQLCVQKFKKKISIAEEVYWHDLYYFGAILCIFFMEPWKTPTDNEKINKTQPLTN